MRPVLLVLTAGVTSTMALVLTGVTPLHTPVRAPQTIPIVDLPPATTRTSTTLGLLLGVREVAGGRVLVNDAGSRQLLLYDTTLTSRHVVFDSVAGQQNSYGTLRVALIPYLGDSSLMADLSGGPGPVLVLDEQGRIARSLALPNSRDAGSLANSPAAVDHKGRILFQLGGRVTMPAAGTVGPQQVFVDSVPVVRADLESRSTDTIGRVSRDKGAYTKIDHTDPKKIIRSVIVNPLPEPDEWAVITDGSVAFVRGHDYHIDWLRPDGSRVSTPKMPFDWKRVTDEDKKKLIDSAMAAHAEQNALAARTRNAPPPPMRPLMSDDGSGGVTSRTAGGAGVTRAEYDASGVLWVPLDYQTVDPKDMADYYPPIRLGAVMADRDNHLWILPTTSAQSRKGELVYDMVDAKGELVERVRLPLGTLVAGFGKGGVVYLLEGDRKNGFHLERTRLPAVKR